MSITEQSGNPESSWALIEAGNLTKGGVLFDFEERTAYPAYKPAYEDPALAQPNDYFGGVKIGQLYSDIADDLPAFRQSPVWPDTTEAIERDVITPVMNDKADAETALTEMKGTVEDLQKEQ